MAPNTSYQICLNVLSNGLSDYNVASPKKFDSSQYMPDDKTFEVKDAENAEDFKCFYGALFG